MNNAATSRSATVPFRAVMVSILGLWFGYFVLLTIRSSLLWSWLAGEVLGRRLIVCAIGVLATLLLWLALRWVSRRSLAIKITVALLAAMPAALAIAQANHLVLQPLEGQIQKKLGEERGLSYRRDERGNLYLEIPPASGEARNERDANAVGRSVLIAPAPTPADYWRMIVEMALGSYFLLLAWSALYLTLLAGAQTRAVEQRLAAAEQSARTAELRALRYQVNPHFLFNTMNSLSALVLTGQQGRAEAMIQKISSFYRQSLTSEPVHKIPLEDEFEAQKLYLEIEQARFPDRLRTRIEYPLELASCGVPGLILQPLVENSIRYAVAPSSQRVTITLRARRDRDRIVLTVSDDGQRDTSGLAEAGLGIGLVNVRERLRALYGEAAALVSEKRGTGWINEVWIPLE